VNRLLTKLLSVVTIVGLSPLVRPAPPTFPGAMAQYRSWTAASGLPGSPEGLAIDAEGHIYASISDTGDIVRLDGRGGYERIATVPSVALARAGFTLGLEFDHQGNLYAAYVWKSSLLSDNDRFNLACRDSTDQYSGIYKIDVHTGQVAAVLTKREGWPVCFPDDIAIDAHGDLFVTDLTLSGIWKIAPGGRFSLWCADPLLQGTAKPGAARPDGANDLVLDASGQNLYVATDGYPAILRIPIRADGSAGPAVAVASDLSPLDGIELDDVGNIYVSETYRSEISAFAADGSQRIVIATKETAPLVNPTSLVYRNGVLCTANLGWSVTPPPRSIVCISGFRRPALK
jgi:sugar lactone lactonase YvrE